MPQARGIAIRIKKDGLFFLQRKIKED